MAKKYKLNAVETEMAKKVRKLNPTAFIGTIKDFYNTPDAENGLWLKWREWEDNKIIWKGITDKTEWYKAKDKLGALVDAFVSPEGFEDLLLVETSENRVEREKREKSKLSEGYSQSLVSKTLSKINESVIKSK